MQSKVQNQPCRSQQVVRHLSWGLLFNDPAYASMRLMVPACRCCSLSGKVSIHGDATSLLVLSARAAMQGSTTSLADELRALLIVRGHSSRPCPCDEQCSSAHRKRSDANRQRALWLRAATSFRSTSDADGSLKFDACPAACTGSSDRQAALEMSITRKSG